MSDLAKKVEAQLDAMIAEVQGQRKAVLESPEFVALCKERDDLIAQIQPLEVKLREVQAKIKAAEAPTRDAGNVFAALIRGKMGTKTLQNTGEAKKEGGDSAPAA